MGGLEDDIQFYTSTDGAPYPARSLGTVFTDNHWSVDMREIWVGTNDTVFQLTEEFEIVASRLSSDAPKHDPKAQEKIVFWFRTPEELKQRVDDHALPKALIPKVLKVIEAARANTRRKVEVIRLSHGMRLIKISIGVWCAYYDVVADYHEFMKELRQFLAKHGIVGERQAEFINRTEKIFWVIHRATSTSFEDLSEAVSKVPLDLTPDESYEFLARLLPDLVDKLVGETVKNIRLKAGL